MNKLKTHFSKVSNEIKLFQNGIITKEQFLSNLEILKKELHKGKNIK